MGYWKSKEMIRNKCVFGQGVMELKVMAVGVKLQDTVMHLYFSINTYCVSFLTVGFLIL